MGVPNFTMYDDKGNTYKLSDFVGKPIVMNFWASWCSPCQGEMPEFEKLYLEMGDEVVFLMINLTGSDNYTDALNFIRQTGYQFPVYYDKRGEASSRYRISSIPVTYFIDAEGNLKSRFIGAMNEEMLRTYIGEIYNPGTESDGQ